jgi:hypothetical protein
MLSSSGVQLLDPLRWHLLVQSEFGTKAELIRVKKNIYINNENNKILFIFWFFRVTSGSVIPASVLSTQKRTGKKGLGIFGTESCSDIRLLTSISWVYPSPPLSFLPPLPPLSLPPSPPLSLPPSPPPLSTFIET